MGCAQTCNKKGKFKINMKNMILNNFQQIEVATVDNFFQNLFQLIQQAQQCYFETVSTEDRFKTATNMHQLFKDPDLITGFKIIIYCIYAFSKGDLSSIKIQLQVTYPFINCQSRKLPNEFHLKDMIISFNNFVENLLTQPETLKEVLKKLKDAEEQLKQIPEEAIKALKQQELDNIALMQKLKTTCYNCAQVKTAITEIENLIHDYEMTMQECSEVAKQALQSGGNGFMDQMVEMGQEVSKRSITHRSDVIKTFWDNKDELKPKKKKSANE